jgi:hypothetical protein
VPPFVQPVAARSSASRGASAARVVSVGFTWSLPPHFGCEGRV